MDVQEAGLRKVGADNAGEQFVLGRGLLFAQRAAAVALSGGTRG
jgi:hypothetical protein